MACCGEHSDEYVRGDAVGVAVCNRRHSGSRCAGLLGNLRMGETACLDDLRQGDGEV